MTDKEQIMINGVNVGGCKYLNTFSDCDGYHYYCDLADDIKNEYCGYYKDCYFKQLARKTQECEELKAYAQRQENQREEYYKEYLKLSQECEGLKRKVELMMDCPDCKVDEYKKALEKIEEEITALHYITIPFHRGITHELADIVQEYKNKILDIINKAKGEGKCQ